MKKIVLISLITVWGLSGCTDAGMSLEPQADTRQHQSSNYGQQRYENPTPEKLNRYEETMKNVASGIQDDSRYERIALDTPEKKAWFKTLTYRLWDRQITRYQFMSEGLSKYPTHQYEFDFVVRGFASH